MPGRRGRAGGNPITEASVEKAVESAKKEGAHRSQIEAQPEPEPKAEPPKPGEPKISLSEWAGGENVNRYVVTRLRHFEPLLRTRDEWAALYKAMKDFGQGDWAAFKKQHNSTKHLSS